MLTSRLALLGATSGPMVHIGRMQRPRLKINGLKLAEIILHGWKGEVEHRQVFTEDGVFPIEVATWVRLHCSPVCKTVICEIIEAA